MKPARAAWPSPAPAAPPRPSPLTPPLDAGTDTRPPLNRVRRLALPWWGAALVLASVCAFALLIGQANPYLGDYGDDAEFLVLGQGLATGQGYAWVNNPQRPAQPHNRYPPGFPAALALAMTLTGTSVPLRDAVLPAKVVPAAALLVSGALLWPIARRRLDAPWAAGAVALFLLNPFVLRFAGEVMSDVPYVMVLLAALAWADHLRASSRFRTWGWVVFGALLALGAYVRSIGLAAGIAALAWAWIVPSGLPWRRPFAGRIAGAALATATFLLLLLPWWLRDASLAGGWRYLEELLAAQYLAPGAGTVSSGDLLSRALGNVLFLAGRPGVFGIAGLAVAVAGAAVVAAGYWGTLRRVGGAAEWVAVALAVAVLFWPIRTGRYLLPLIPLLGIYAIAGALAFAPLVPALRRFGVRIIALGLVLGALLQGVYAGREALANGRSLRAGGGAAGYYGDRPEWSRYLQAAAWLERNGDPDGVVLGRRHFALYVYGERFADKYRFEVTAEELDYLFSFSTPPSGAPAGGAGAAGGRRTYVVEDAFSELRGDFPSLLPAVRARGGDLRLRYETAPPQVRVWELVPASSGADNGS